MAAFSPSDAAIEGFRVIGARWRVVVGWSLFNLITLIALFVVMVVLLVGTIPFAGTRETASTLGAVIGVAIVGLGELIVQVTLICGLMRLELRPEEPGFLHLRIGRDELRVFGAMLLVVLVAALLLAVLAGVTVLGARTSTPLGVLVGFAGAIGVYAVLLRLGLVSPIAFAERRISLVDSWRRTRGQLWSLLGMAVLLLCFTLLLAVIVWFALFLLSGFATGFGDLGLSGREAMQAHPGRYVLQLAVQVLLAPFWLVIGIAPWIAVYRALTPAQET